MEIYAGYPTIYHSKVAERIVDLFSRDRRVEAVILTCSCARGKGIRDIDFCLLVSPDTNAADSERIEAKWIKAYNKVPLFTGFKNQGRFYQVDLWVTNGIFSPKHKLLSENPDNFELDIGNTFVYTVPLWQRSKYFNQQKEMWLPYYNEILRKSRLKESKYYCAENIEYAKWFNKRKLYFQSFKRLYIAIQDFIQALFINQKKYPIAYDKWLKEQFEEILQLPSLYPSILSLIELDDIKSNEIIQKGNTLNKLIINYL